MPGPTSCTSRPGIAVPGTNGVIERFFEAQKYERLFRHDIADGDQVAAHVAAFIDDYNHIRPHENLDWWRPAEIYLDNPTNPQTPNLSKNLDTGQTRASRPWDSAEPQM